MTQPPIREDLQMNFAALIDLSAVFPLHLPATENRTYLNRLLRSSFYCVSGINFLALLAGAPKEVAATSWLLFWALCALSRDALSYPWSEQASMRVGSRSWWTSPVRTTISRPSLQALLRGAGWRCGTIAS